MTELIRLSLAAALTDRPLVLDGGLSTELERQGYDISGRLWSARMLQDAPEAVVAAHSAFLRAGAEVITTAGYQASVEGYVRAGFSRSDGERLLRRSVELAVRARDETPVPDTRSAQPNSTQPGPAWVAGSVGPYGALLADGSEYTGDYGVDVDLRRLREFHRPRLEILAATDLDVLAAETVPSLVEAEALCLELATLGRPAWLSLTTTTGDDGVIRTRRGEPAAEAFAMAAGVDAIVAVGVNCTEPHGLAAAIEVAAKASGKPVIAYPNSGEGWDAQSRSWIGRPTSASGSGFGAAEIRSWLESGARMVGGCCRVGPNEIADVARQLAVFSPTTRATIDPRAGIPGSVPGASQQASA
jgi:homocysteine S-methyltransferase